MSGRASHTKYPSNADRWSPWPATDLETSMHCEFSARRG